LRTGAAEQAQHLVIDVSVSQLEANLERRDALLWNFTVLGEAASRVSDEIKARFRMSPGRRRPCPGASRKDDTNADARASCATGACAP